MCELETERDFYFSKLRDIELLCQENEGLEVVTKIMAVMYATQVSCRRMQDLWREKTMHVPPKPKLAVPCLSLFSAHPPLSRRFAVGAQLN